MLYKCMAQNSLHAFNEEGEIHPEAVIIHLIRADIHVSFKTTINLS